MSYIAYRPSRGKRIVQLEFEAFDPLESCCGIMDVGPFQKMYSTIKESLNPKVATPKSPPRRMLLKHSSKS